MKTSSLLFKRRISILGLCLFIIVTTIKTLFNLFKWSINTIIKTIKWIKNYFHFVKSGYSYSDVYDLINNMTGREFEKFILYLFKELGYKCKLTKATNDGGKDLILYNENEGNTYIECKRWDMNGDFKIGRPEIQKLIGAADGDCIPNALFITTGKYTKEAYEYANKIDNLELWDISNIMKMICKVNQKQIPKILIKSLNNTNTRIIRLKPCTK